jgi:hypothetical protein
MMRIIVFLFSLFHSPFFLLSKEISDDIETVMPLYHTKLYQKNVFFIIIFLKKKDELLIDWKTLIIVATLI